MANGFWAHSFELACAQNEIDHRLAKPRHPWINGQVAWMNRTIKEGTVKRYQYETHDELRQRLGDFVAAHNFDRRLKTQGPDTLRSHLQSVASQAQAIHVRSDPPNPGANYLAVESCKAPIQIRPAPFRRRAC